MKQRSLSSSSQRQRASTPRPMNHACRDVGHDWQVTTNDAFRQCRRQDCRAVERLVYGSWMPVPSSPRQSETPYLSDLYQQQSFWSCSQHTDRPLDLERLTLLTSSEQRAHFAHLEKEHYNLSSERQRNRKAW